MIKTYSESDSRIEELVSGLEKAVIAEQGLIGRCDCYLRRASDLADNKI